MPERSTPASSDHRFIDLVHAIVSGDAAKALRLSDTSPTLVRQRAAVGASRDGAKGCFFEPIAHYMYEGDTALHMAAAGFQYEIAQVLIDRGADCSARNRRGAVPLHYAADANVWNPTAQAATIGCLIRAGSDPNASDKSGVAPLHRAVRTRCAAAVEALLAGGADPRSRNKNGSTPLHLAVQNTGRGNSGSPHAVEQQRRIIGLLLAAGATPEDKDDNGKAVRDAATADWIRALF
ncbi:ankyrin repeat domain-containing protein [Afipia sp. GAS231]|uniref:ankyrin repeat domain-containing protein n=1 Tax=Afipia sp. GAS231 TaxID=1882747 RepID=UPI00087D0A4D|nr:ankyrin repeat domain-containing protein [Afipia sp. GAS231]SDN10251.1 Ankyrin repeat-containing protein [Afipia sp. GAS231]